MADRINTHDMIMTNGRHKGERVTRVPVSYLKWMVNAGHGMAEVAQAELDRRGTVTPDCEISGHALDRASLSCRKTWNQTANEGEGLHAWLVRMTMEALAAKRMKGDKFLHNGMELVIENDGVWPVLKTIHPE